MFWFQSRHFGNSVWLQWSVPKTCWKKVILPRRRSLNKINVFEKQWGCFYEKKIVTKKGSWRRREVLKWIAMTNGAILIKIVLSNHMLFVLKEFRNDPLIEVVVAEWLRRWTRNPLGSPRTGSNPADYDQFFWSFHFILFLREKDCSVGDESWNKIWHPFVPNQELVK